MRADQWGVVLLAVLVPVSCVTAGSTLFMAYVLFEFLRQLGEAM